MSEISNFGGFGHFLYGYASGFVRDKTVLDLCCGYGRGAAILANSGSKSVVGIDYSRKAIKEALKHKSPVLDFVIQDIDKDPGIEGYYDVVVFFNAIEHFSEPSQNAILLNLGRVLNNGGVLLISTDNQILSRNGLFKYSFHKNELSASAFKELISKYFKAEFYGVKQKFDPRFNREGLRNRAVNFIFGPKFMQEVIQPAIPRMIKDFVNTRLLKLAPARGSDFYLSDEMTSSENFLAVCKKC